jgi:hypothetical protein
MIKIESATSYKIALKGILEQIGDIVITDEKEGGKETLSGIELKHLIGKSVTITIGNKEVEDET